MGFVPDFGSVPDWVEAIGTSGALIFLVVQLQRERRKDRAAATHAEAALRDEQARQARLVSVTSKLAFRNWPGAGDSEESGWVAMVTLHNDSAEPIRNVEPHIGMRYSPADDLPPGFRWSGLFTERPDCAISKVWWGNSEARAVVRPGGELHVEFVPTIQPIAEDEQADASRRGPFDGDPPPAVYDKYEIGAIFTDAAGLRWSQTETGTPIRELQLPRRVSRVEREGRPQLGVLETDK